MKKPSLTQQEINALRSMSAYWTEIEDRNPQFSTTVLNNEFMELSFEIIPEQILRIISSYIEQELYSSAQSPFVQQSNSLVL